MIIAPCYIGNDSEWWIESDLAVSMKIHEEKEGTSPDSAYNQTSLLRRAKAFCKPGSDILRNLFADVYQKAGLPWDEEQESKLDLAIACIADAAVIEARNERKGLANRRTPRRL